MGGVDLDTFRRMLKNRIGLEKKISFIKKARRPPRSLSFEEMLLRATAWKVSSLEGLTLLDGSVIPDARYNITEIDFLRSIWVDVFRMKIQDPSSHQECLPIVHLLLISGARVQKVHQYFSLQNMLEIAEV